MVGTVPVGSRWLVALALAALAGCGGGISLGFGFGDDDFDGSLPSVSLAADRGSAPPGGNVQLIAAASDPSGIDSVAFYELDDANAATLLGADGTAPFQWSATIAIDATGSVRYFARATDGFGRQADSAVVTVSVGS